MPNRSVRLWPPSPISVLAAASRAKSEMSDRFFLDTNLLVYAVDPSDPAKQTIALEWITSAHQTGHGILSYQVVQEWFNVVLRKAAAPLSPDEATSIYRALIEPLWRTQSSRELLDTALELHRKDSFSWWDSLIVSAAIHGGCRELLSEDLQAGREISGVRIHNPFR
jgi:predicted nucleic acid-binding protein